MAFSSYKNIGEVLKEYQVTYTEAKFVDEIPFNVPDYFRQDFAKGTRETRETRENKNS